jgi:hypothetical protein
MNYRYLSMLARLMAWLWTSLLRSFWTSYWGGDVDVRQQVIQEL